MQYESRPEDQWRWGNILANLQEIDILTWIKELGKAISRCYYGRTSYPIESTFRAADGGKIFRPILQDVEDWSDGSKRFTVCFTEQVSEAWVTNAPKLELATLLTNLNLGARLQWEVCDYYLNQWEHRVREARIKDNLTCIIHEHFQGV